MRHGLASFDESNRVDLLALFDDFVEITLKTRRRNNHQQLCRSGAGIPKSMNGASRHQNERTRRGSDNLFAYLDVDVAFKNVKRFFFGVVNMLRQGLSQLREFHEGCMRHQFRRAWLFG